MQNNLIPPFMMRKAGIILNDMPKMQVEHPTVDDHSIFFPAETKFRIPMSLWGIFSYFPTSKPTAQDMKESDQVYMLTPSRWDPHQSAYAENEESILDWEGNVIKAKDRQHVLPVLLYIVEDTAMAASVQIGSIKVAAINRVMGTTTNDDYDKPHPSYNHIPHAADQVSSILAGISPLLDDQTLYVKMEARANLGKFQSAIGSTNATSSDYLMDDDATQDTESNTDNEESIETNAHLMDTLYEEAVSGTLHLDNVMLSAAHASQPTGIIAEQLSKTWRINMDAAERTIGITS
jgi:hypothetical protein